MKIVETYEFSTTLYSIPSEIHILWMLLVLFYICYGYKIVLFNCKN